MLEASSCLGGSWAVDTEIPITRVWWAWRGSPELLVRVVRVADECVSDYVGGSAVLMRFSVKVGEDSEEFTSIDAIREFITPDALRNFDEIDLHVGDGSWPPWITVRISREGRIIRSGSVWLTVESGHSAITDAVYQKMTAVLNRGSKRGNTLINKALFSGAMRFVFPFLLLLIIVSLEFLFFGILALLRVDSSWVAIPIAIVFLLLFGVAFNLILLDRVEVIPAGETPLQRATRVAVTVIIGLVITGLAKLLFG
jgi:hypothetical protein